MACYQLLRRVLSSLVASTLLLLFWPLMRWCQEEEDLMSKVNGKGKVGQSNSNPKKVDSNIALVSDPNEAICFYCQLKGHWL